MTQLYWHFFLFLLGFSGAALFCLAIFFSRRKQFYSDTFTFFPLGAYVWGDGLILGPFWLVSAILLSGVTPQLGIRFFFLFYAIRSAYEVVYWLNHQVAQRAYIPPLFRRWEWLNANESAILYQLMHTCICVIMLFLLFFR